MKFLHTGDLHLGKFFYEYPLLEDQQYVLQLLLDELKREQEAGAPYDALVIAGDIYDRSLPPADAVQVFSDFLAEVQKSFDNLYVLIIPGNHDSAIRLSYAQKILEQQRIHIRTDLSRIDEPVIIKDTAFYLMPFLQPASLSSMEKKAENDDEQTKRKQVDSEKNEAASDMVQNLSFDFDSNNDERETPSESQNNGNKNEFIMSQSALAAEAIRRINLTKSEEFSNVLIAHLFTIGSIESDSERIIWGTAEQVDSSLFKDFSYTALGHLHRYQKASENVFYSGSPLAYSFSESSSEKVFLRVEIEKGKETSVTAIPIKPLHKVVSVKGTFEEFFNSKIYDDYKDCFLEIESTEELLIENPVVLLRKKFPYLLSFKQDKAFEKLSSSELAGRRADISDSELTINNQFELFMKEIKGPDIDYSAETSLFDKLFARMKEENHETE